MDNYLKKIQEWMEKSIIDDIIIIVLLIAIVESIAQNRIKLSNNDDSGTFILGLLAYVIVGYLLHYAYHKYPLSKVNVMWSCLSIVLAAALGYTLYDEPLNGKLLLAVFFSLLAIYFAYDS